MLAHRSSWREAGKAMGDAAGCEIIVVLEDRRHQRFVRKVLSGLGFTHRNFRIRMAPPGKGDAVSAVQKKYASDVGLYRKRQKKVRPNSAVLAVIDEDGKTSEIRLRQMDDALRSENLDPRNVDESIAIWVPKRHIETWLLHLCGQEVNEEEKTKDKHRQFDEKAAASEFVRILRGEQRVISLPLLPSIASAIGETRRIWH